MRTTLLFGTAKPILSRPCVPPRRGLRAIHARRLCEHGVRKPGVAAHVRGLPGTHAVDAEAESGICGAASLSAASRHWKGKTIYAYKDEKAGVAYIGNKANYAQFQQLAAKANLAEEKQVAHNMDNDLVYRWYGSWDDFGAASPVD